MATVREMKATTRPRAGKGAARAERRAGRVPGVIYGDDKDPITISVDHAELKQRIYAGRFLTTIYELDVEGTKHRVIPRDFQLDPVRDLPVHVDFLRLGVGAKIRVRIPVRIWCRGGAGRRRGGTVNIATMRSVQCPADDIGIDRRRHSELEIATRSISASSCSRSRGNDLAHRQTWSPSCRRPATRKR